MNGTLVETNVAAAAAAPASGWRELLRRREVRKALLIALAVIVAVGLVARLKFAPLPVLAHPVSRQAVAAEVMGTGTLEAHTRATISAKIQGRLAAVLVDQNDSVTTGQLLARLDDGEWTQQVEIAGAALAAARATVERVRTDLARAEAVQTQSQLGHERVSALRKSGVATPSDLDKAVENLNIAQADLRRSLAAVNEADKQVVTAEKTLAFHQERLADTRLLSPFDGLVVRRLRDAGDVAVPGSSVLELISTKELWISAWVDETAMSQLAAGQPARVVFRSEPANNYPGEVARLGRQADPETRAFVVDVRVKQLPANWAIGQRAEVFIETGRKENALVIPAHALQWQKGEAGLFVAGGSKARWRTVTLGLRGREFVEVARGVSEGEMVLTPQDPARALSDGQRIALP
jgi:HlyD family secretion protein